jgi:AraC family transcriptional regulator
MSMNSHATTMVSRATGNRRAPPYAGLSHPPGRLGDKWADERSNHDPVRLPPGQPKFDAITSLIQFSPAESVRRHAVNWDGVAAEIVHVTKHARIECRFRAPVHMLVMFEAGERSDGFTFVEGLPRSALRNYKRKLVFVPAGHEYYDWQEPRSLVRAAHFYFDPAALPVRPDAACGAIPLAPRLFFEDAAIWDIATKLKAVIDGPQASDRLYREALGTVLAHELARLDPGAGRPGAPARGGLAAWQQRTVVAHIEEHLTEQISLSALAQLVRLSPYHFCRAFKKSFGIPPHRFHTHRRMEHAKVLLAKPAASVTDVGIAIGFSATSSFTTAFRNATGLTPTGYQRSVA